MPTLRMRLRRRFKGRAQVGLWFPYDTLDFPLIDVFKMVGRFWRAAGTPTEDYFALMDANGWPTRLANGIYQYQTTFAAYIADPADNDRWVATWTGGSGFTVGVDPSNPGATLTQVASSPNRLEFTLTSGTLASYTPINLNLTMTDLTTPVTSFQFFRKSHESELLAGRITAPQFRSANSRWGRMRFMDPLATNANNQCLWSSRVTPNRRSWVGVDLDMAAYCGEASQSGNDYTCAAAPTGNPTTWTHGQRVQFAMLAAPTFKTFASFSSTNPCQISFASAHGWTTGKSVEFGAQPTAVGAFDQAVDGKTFSITVIDANTISIPLDATGMTYVNHSYSQAIGEVVRFKAGALPLKRVCRFDGGSNYNNTYSAAYLKSNFGGTTWVNLVYDADFDALISSSQYDLAYYGFPHEAICQIANELHVDPWVCIPHQADDNYVTQMAAVYRDNLSADLVANFEYSNEVWNSAGGFNQTFYALRKANLKWGSADYNLWYGYRFYQTMSLIGAVFDQAMHRINRIMACFTGAYGAGGQDTRFQAPGTGLATFPIALADSIAIAPYFENSTRTIDAQYVWQAVYGDPTQKQAAIAYFDGQLRDDGVNTGYTVKHLHDTVFPSWAAIAATPAPGVGAKKLTMYEDGPGQFMLSYYGMTNNPPPSSPGTAMNGTDLFNAQKLYLASPECAATCSQNWNNFVAAGGEYPAHYTLSSDSTSPWGLIVPGSFGTKLPIYDAFSAFNEG